MFESIWMKNKSVKEFLAVNLGQPLQPSAAFMSLAREHLPRTSALGRAGRSDGGQNVTFPCPSAGGAPK